MRLSFRLAWRFIIKSYKQSLLIMFTIIAGIGSVVFVMSLASSLDNMLNNFVIENFPHLEIKYDAKIEDYFEINEKFKETILNEPLVDDFIYLYWDNLELQFSNETRKPIKATLHGVEDFSDLTYFNLDKKMIKGNFPTNTNEVIIENNYFELNDLKIGDKLNFASKRFGNIEIIIVGTFRADASKVNKDIGYFVLEDFNNKTALAAHLYFKLNDPNQVSYFYNDILKEHLDNYYPNTTYLVSYWTDHINFAQEIKISQTVFLIVMQLFISLVIFLLTSSLISFSINKKMKEIGILKALGYKNYNIYFAFLIQILILGIISSILGLITAHYGLDIFQKVMTDDNNRYILDVIKNPKIYFNSILIVFIVVLISVLVSLRKVNIKNTIELLK